MLNIGFIGFGHMAKMLIACLIDQGGIDPHTIFVTRRNSEKLKEIPALFPHVTAVATPLQLAEQCRLIFLCVKPAQIKEVGCAILPALNSDTHIVSIAAGVSLDYLQKLLTPQVSRLLPSVTLATPQGVALLAHSDRLPETDAAFLQKLIGRFATVKLLKESDMDLAMVLTGCLPGLLAAFYEELTQAACRCTGELTPVDIREMIRKTVFATSLLLDHDNTGFSALQAAVATKGGVTQAGIDVLDRSLPALLDTLLCTTLAKAQTVNPDKG